ncbi:MAG: tetratricopeptide repeat protein [Scytolyngbya sp. HA4215-MV1]|jgi:CHAT domain-containing protein/Tfp pilus assembly protein PilF|nr:tetratricopeptide repeat protein [Scytolyngbya sp. HA4215-MV1]
MRPLKSIGLAAMLLVLGVSVPVALVSVGLPGFAQTSQSQRVEVDQLAQQGDRQYREGKFPEALATYQRVVTLRQQIKDRPGEGEAFYNVGRTYYQLTRYTDALKAYQQALAIRSDFNDKDGVAVILNSVGRTYYKLNNYAQALKIYQRALELRLEVGDRLGEAITRDDLGNVYRGMGDFAQAVESHQKALELTRQLGAKPADEAKILNNLGLAYEGSSKYQAALEAYQQALERFKALNQVPNITTTLTNISSIYINLGQFAAAEKSLQEALQIAKEIGSQRDEAAILNNVGAIRERLGQYSKALEAYQRAAEIFLALEDLSKQADMFNNIGVVYERLGQYPKSLEFFQKALLIRQSIGDRAGEGSSLNNMGTIYYKSQQYSKALELCQQALKLARDSGDRSGEAVTLNNLGTTRNKLGDFRQAAELYQQTLEIRAEVGDLLGEAITLGNLGSAYHSLKAYPQALGFYQRALGMARSLGDRQTERVILANMGHLFREQAQPDLAIAFYKQSVNVTEAIRKDLRSLSRQDQEAYTQTVAMTYRNLADTLLTKGRVAEAQQVLELLKVQELQDFTEDVENKTEKMGVTIAPIEASILQENGSLIAFGQKVEQCKQTQCSQLPQLTAQLQALNQQYDQTVQSFEKEIQQRLKNDPSSLDPAILPGLKSLVESQPGTVLIYPLVLKDKIWLLMAAQGGIVKRYEVPVNEAQLGEAVLKFRRLVQDRRFRPKGAQAAGKQLYEWLVRPLEKELDANQIKHLVFALDRSTRYLPMGALFDGNQYLIEKYTVSTVLSANLTNLSERLPTGVQNTTILALGASEFTGGFNPLPNVPTELDAIVRKHKSDVQGIYPGLEFLNQAFNLTTLQANLPGRKILHIATHAAFVSGRPEDSYLVLGNGKKMTTDEIKTLTRLGDVHLVVLSACETALGGPDQDGIEISGISSYFLNAGAKAVIASLWSVDDASTSQLMREFYGILAKSTAENPVTKAEALRQAQLSLLHTQTNDADFSHPYFWAPFILIGNGL